MGMALSAPTWPSSQWPVDEGGKDKRKGVKPRRKDTGEVTTVQKVYVSHFDSTNLVRVKKKTRNRKKERKRKGSNRTLNTREKKN